MLYIRIRQLSVIYVFIFLYIPKIIIGRMGEQMQRKKNTDTIFFCATIFSKMSAVLQKVSTFIREGNKIVVAHPCHLYFVTYVAGRY